MFWFVLDLSWWRCLWVFAFGSGVGGRVVAPLIFVVVPLGCEFTCGADVRAARCDVVCAELAGCDCRGAKVVLRSHVVGALVDILLLSGVVCVAARLCRPRHSLCAVVVLWCGVLCPVIQNAGVWSAARVRGWRCGRLW